MTTELMPRQTETFLLPDEVNFKRDLEAINKFQMIVKETFVKDVDYGKPFPGSDKDSLLKPGAEKIIKILGLCDVYTFEDRVEKWEKDNPFFRYLIKCQLKTPYGLVVAEGFGECNSLEAKYRWREAQRVCPECGKEAIIRGKEEWGGGWLCWAKKGGCGAKFADNDPQIAGQVVGKVENDDIFSQVNTMVKMAKKRAQIDAALSAGRLSNLFTQDGDAADMDEGGIRTIEARKEKTKVTEKALVPGSDEWIKRKITELNISESGLLEYLNTTLHIPVEATMEKTLPKLTDAQRSEVAKAISQKEKQTKAQNR